MHHSRGFLIGNQPDRANALAFVADGRVKAEIELQSLSAIYSAFKRRARGECAVARGA